MIQRQAFVTFAVVGWIGMTASLFRTSTAVVAPDVLADLGLGAAWAAYITGGYFLAATLFQLPAGILFDRFGICRVTPVLFAVAALGAAVFATAHSGASLIAGRLLMGVGCGAVMTGGIVLCSRWFDPGRFSAVAGLLYAVAQLGMLMSTTPTALLVVEVGWRNTFLVGTAIALCLSLTHLVLLREHPPEIPRPPPKAESLAAALQRSLGILKNRQLWPIYVMAFVSYAANFSISGVWGAVYLADVHGLGLIDRGNVLFAMILAYALGLYAFGWLSQKVGSQKPIVILGMSLACASFLLIGALPSPPLPVSVILLVLLGGFGGSCSMLIIHGNRFYPDDAMARGMTILNMVILGGSLAFQAVGGLLMDGLSSAGLHPARAFQVLFLAHGLCVLGGLIVYCRAAERP